MRSRGRSPLPGSKRDVWSFVLSVALARLVLVPGRLRLELEAEVGGTAGRDLDPIGGEARPRRPRHDLAPAGGDAADLERAVGFDLGEITVGDDERAGGHLGVNVAVDVDRPRLQERVSLRIRGCVVESEIEAVARAQ